MVFTRDSVTLQVDDDTSDDGVVFSEDDLVQVENEEWTDAFETDKFYRKEATVARPIEQKYFINDTEFTFKKTRDALKKSAWSLHNTPYTLDHPDSKRITDRNEIHGFWRDPEYKDETDELACSLYVPHNDEEAINYLSDSSEVSVGFVNDFDKADEDGVDAYQTDIYYDHVASVKRGRCSGDDGCGIHNDGGELNNMVDLESYELVDCVFGGVDARATEGEKIGDGLWESEDGVVYGVAPSENSDGVPKFPMMDCDDVNDAWDLRGTGDIDIEQSTLADRIKVRSGELGCDLPESAKTDSGSVCSHCENDCNLPESAKTDSGSVCSHCGNDCNLPESAKNDSASVCNHSESNGDFMTECNCDKKEDGIGIDLDKFKIDALAEKNDEVKQVVDERDEYEDKIDILEDKVDKLQDELESYRSDEKDELVSEITDITDKWSEDDLKDEDIGTLRDRVELVEDVYADSSTANSTTDREESSSVRETNSKTGTYKLR